MEKIVCLRLIKTGVNTKPGTIDSNESHIVSRLYVTVDKLDNMLTSYLVTIGVEILREDQHISRVGVRQ